MRTKSVPARVKAQAKATDDGTATDNADGLQPGQFKAIVSVFGNEDSMGDVIVPGAFTQVLADWAASGRPIPVVWSHRWSDPDAIMGRVLTATETAEGLEVVGQIEHMDTNRDAAQVHNLLVDGLVSNFSFAYDIGEGGWVDTDDLENHPRGGYYEIRRFSALYEVGPCLVGANQETSLEAVKVANAVHAAKEGRVLAQQHVDNLKDARAILDTVIGAAEGGKATEPRDETTERPDAAGETTTPSTGDEEAITDAKSAAADLRMRADLVLATAWATDPEE